MTEPSLLPKKYKNMTQVPLVVDVPSHGSASIGGKGKVWLWPSDVVVADVARYIADGTLAPWDDGEACPAVRPNSGTVAVDITLDIRPSSVAVLMPSGSVEIRVQKQTLAQVLLEGEAAEVDAGNQGVSSLVAPTGEEKKAESGPRKRG